MTLCFIKIFKRQFQDSFLEYMNTDQISCVLFDKSWIVTVFSCFQWKTHLRVIFLHLCCLFSISESVTNSNQSKLQILQKFKNWVPWNLNLSLTVLLVLTAGIIVVSSSKLTPDSGIIPGYIFYTIHPHADWRDLN